MLTLCKMTMQQYTLYETQIWGVSGK